MDHFIGRRILERRRLLKLTQSSLGLTMGVSPQQIQKYELGRNRIAASALFELARVLNVPITYFYPEEATHEAPAHQTSESVAIVDTLNALPANIRKTFTQLVAQTSASIRKNQRIR